eukprot:CAMPEP_0177661820 /NCGR_PEP_ID=MMETSP0447-20121125/18919_1 /TAXON_ID=0 /ORGANISM="Stygamoeba regulata, Strain BSH-02190019" /LENGTH=198 /DNA_ID=CAMNT_0019167261 /DNA_START=178 /DNA_END=774 /DNA_ORIENTATION=-
MTSTVIGATLGFCFGLFPCHLDSQFYFDSMASRYIQLMFPRLATAPMLPFTYLLTLDDHSKSYLSRVNSLTYVLQSLALKCALKLAVRWNSWYDFNLAASSFFTGRHFLEFTQAFYVGLALAGSTGAMGLARGAVEATCTLLDETWPTRLLSVYAVTFLRIQDSLLVPFRGLDSGLFQIIRSVMSFKAVLAHFDHVFW